MEIKKILVLGAKGMLGNVIFSYLGKNKLFDVYGTSSQKYNDLLNFKVDLNYIDNINKILEKYNFDYVINCIGKIRPGDKVKDYNDTFIINSHFPKTLQLLSYKYNFQLIHFSTDCVFNGKIGNYKIDSIPDELGLYGMSKYLGEINDNRNLTIRTSIIGIELNNNSRNLLNWFLSNKDGSTIKGYSNVYWNGLTTFTVAKIIEKIIKENLNISGLVQLGSEKISKYKLLLLFNKVFNKNLNIIEEKNIFSDKTIINSKEYIYFKSIISNLEEQIIELKKYYNL